MADKQSTNLSLVKLILIITTTIFSFSSMSSAYYMMGVKSLFWLLIAALFYFIPYVLIVSEFTATYKNKSGGIYCWLQDVFSPKIAFITTFLWYCSYFIWLISLLMKMWIPLSIIITGKDISSQDFLFWGIPNTVWLSIFSILAIVIITILISRGFKTVSFFMVCSGIFMMILMAVCIIGNLILMYFYPDQILPNLEASYANISFFSMTSSAATDANSSNLIFQLPYLIFAITALGGLDTIASLVNEMGSIRNKFYKAVVISSLLIMILYFGGIMIWSMGSNLTDMRAQNLHLGNLMYGLVYQLTVSVGHALNLSTQTIYYLSRLSVVFSAFTLFFAYIGLLSVITYAPLKSLIGGTPANFWPKKLTTLNSFGVPSNALWGQAILLSVFIVFITISNYFASNIYNQLTYMTNISRSIPYLIIAFSFPFFRANKDILHPVILIKKHYMIKPLALSVSLCIFIGIFFQLYQPILESNFSKLGCLIGGPLFFGFCGYSLFYFFYNKPIWNR